MKTFIEKEAAQLLGADALLKTTALIYFREALAKEQFERCRELVDLAREFGAREREVKEVIADYLRPFKRR